MWIWTVEGGESGARVMEANSKVGGVTVSSNLAYVFFLIESKSPFFLKVWSRPSIEARLAEDRGSSETFGFLRGGKTKSLAPFLSTAVAMMASEYGR